MQAGTIGVKSLSRSHVTYPGTVRLSDGRHLDDATLRLLGDACRPEQSFEHSGALIQDLQRSGEVTRAG